MGREECVFNKEIPQIEFWATDVWYSIFSNSCPIIEDRHSSTEFTGKLSIQCWNTFTTIGQWHTKFPAFIHWIIRIAVPCHVRIECYLQRNQSTKIQALHMRQLAVHHIYHFILILDDFSVQMLRTICANASVRHTKKKQCTWFGVWEQCNNNEQRQ